MQTVASSAFLALLPHVRKVSSPVHGLQIYCENISQKTHLYFPREGVANFKINGFEVGPVLVNSR